MILTNKKLLGLIISLFAVILLSACQPHEHQPHEHKFSNWQRTTSATCTVAGQQTRTCSCGEKETKSIPATGHNYVQGFCSTCDAKDPNYIADYGVDYIGERTAHYYSDKNEYIIFFGLMDKDKKLMSASGTATISITDGSATLYQSVIDFTESDFSTWTHDDWETSKLLCGLHIPYSKISTGSKKNGIVNLKVELKDGTWFDNSEISISNLPINANSDENIQEVLADIERYPTYLKLKGDILLAQVERYKVTDSATAVKIVKEMIESVSEMQGYLQKIIDECEPYDSLYPLVSQCEIDIPVFTGNYNSYVSDVKLFATRCTRIQGIYEIYVNQ